MADELREDIAKAAALLPVRLGSGREIRKLVNHLWEGETVHLLATGQYGSGMGLLAVTDRRLLFLKDGMMSTKSEDFPISKISSIQWNSGMLTGKITIFASGNKADIERIDKGRGQAIVDHVRALISNPTPPAQPAAPVTTETESPMDQLKKLGELRDAGIISEEEFELKKKEFLDRM